MRKLKAILMIMSCSIILPLASCANTGDVLTTGTVNIKAMANGSITSDITSGNVNDVVTLTITPNSGYAIYTLNVNGTSIVDDVNNNKVTFKLESGENTVTGSFKASSEANKTGTVTISSVTNGTIVSNKTSGNAGETVTLTITPNSGYTLNSITANGTSIIDNVKSNKVTFTLIAGENLVVGTFRAIDESTDSVKKLSKSDIRFSNRELGESGETCYTPSTGSPNILVVPIQFSDVTSKWTSTKLTELNNVCNGTNADGSTSYWESTASFYKKSSYGALTPTYTITDTVIPTMTAALFKKNSDDYGTETLTLIDQIYDSIAVNGTKVSSDISKYDSDGDNIIDGVWFIYNEFNMNNVNSSSYWAYTYYFYADDDRTSGSVAKNIPISAYANMAGAFNYEDSAAGLDSHTMIHESGHMFGLEDYYSYDEISNSASGGLDMMDLNIGEHNAFSKLSLGWVEPTVVTGNSGSITLKPFESSGDCLIVPSSYFNDSAFGEYLIIEYYTPTGLNYRDANNSYPDRSLYLSQSGIRVFHVDARIMKLTYNTKQQDYLYTGSYLSEDATTIPAYNTATDSYYAMAYSNTASRSYSSSNYLLSAVDAQNRKIYNTRDVDNNSLFKEGTNINKTTISTFLKSGKFNDGTSFDYNISIDSIGDTGATLSFTK
jgi:M6 family metalloprotease-like protein